MRWRALAADFDGTLAEDGQMPEELYEALMALRRSGRAVVLVTGRELRDFERLSIGLEVFDLVVAENGAVLHRPEAGTTTVLAEPPPPAFVQGLERRGVRPLSVGAAIVATRQPWERVVADVIREQGLPLQVIFNKGAVMVLPVGVSKASGLRHALRELDIAASDAVGVGDGENDYAFLDLCGLSVAVANAVPALKAHAHHVTAREAGYGVAELIQALLAGAFDALPQGPGARP